MIEKFVSKMKDYVLHPHKLGKAILNHTASLWPDNLYVRLRYYFVFGKFPDFKNPKSFNEKLNWLKLHYHKPEFSLMADKYEVKNIVERIIGKEYVVPCLGLWDSPDDIDFDKLPYPCVLKATNDSSGTIICKDKNIINPTEIKNKLKISMNRNWFWHSREWAYKNIKPRIIADMYLDDGTGHELVDYKFWCFNGSPQVMYCTNKADDVFENFYDMAFTPMPINHGFRRQSPEFEKPEAFELMKELCTKLCKGCPDLPFVRIDFFYVGGHVYFGEFTFYDWGGMKPFGNSIDDIELGKKIRLPKQ